MCGDPTRHVMNRTALAVALMALVALPLATLAEEPEIQTVTITAKKEERVKKIDKTVHDVSNMPKAANGTAQDVLQSTPDVSVTAEGRISVKGNSQVTVLVDGKPTAMLSGEGQAVALQTMSGADIASVEVITNPSAALNANGGAILNIILKRNRKQGARAQIQASASNQGLWNGGTSGDITRKEVSVRGNLALRHDGTLKFRESAVDWIHPLSSQTKHTLQTSEVFVHRTVKSAGFGVDYGLSSTDSLGFSARYNSRGSRPLLDTLNVERTGADESIFHRVSFGPNEQSDRSASLSYDHHGSGEALKAAVQRSNTIALIDKSYSDVFVKPARAIGYSHGATRSARDLTQGTLDWSKKSGHGQWGIGIDLQNQVDDIDNYQASIDTSTATEIQDPNTTNGYAVRSTLSAVYLTDQIRHEKWEVLLGGRAEYLALEVGPPQSKSRKNHRRAFNPSLHVQYDLSEDADLTLSYRRSLQRPDPRDLNPATSYIDAQNLSRGNPDLEPQLLSAWEIGSSARFGSMNGNCSAFYRTSRDTVVDARSFADHVLITSKQNGGRARSAGLSGGLEWKNNGKFSWGVDGSVYRVTLRTPDLHQVVRQDGTSGYMNLRAAFADGNDDLALDAHIQSEAITPLGRYGRVSSLNLTWKRRLSKSLNLTVNASDLLDGSKRSYQTYSEAFHQEGFDHFVARRIYIGLVKKFE